MMVLSPIVSYLMAETFAISGLLSLMCCALVQSIYAYKNLEEERKTLLLNAFKALSYTFRSICDILIGISLAIHFSILLKIGEWTLIGTIAIIFISSFGLSYLILKQAKAGSLLKSDTEFFILLL
jgi:NhaP-type Na+/H+ or K+/H+ antiporter